MVSESVFEPNSFLYFTNVSRTFMSTFIVVEVIINKDIKRRERFKLFGDCINNILKV